VGVITLLTTIRGDRDVAKYRRTLSGILVILGVVLTIILSIRYEYIAEVALLKDEDTLKTIESLRDAKGKIKATNIHLLQEVFTEREKAFNDTIKGISANKITLSPEELGRHAVKLFQNEQNTTILATSYVKPTEWWKTAWGKEYLQQNFAAVTRGVTIERIYIFADQKEMDEIKELLLMQKANKITVRYIFANDVANLAIKDDVIIIGDKLCGTLNLKEGRTMLDAVFSIDKEEIAKNKSKFEELKKFSREF
jgi:predicted small secreted protein